MAHRAVRRRQSKRSASVERVPGLHQEVLGLLLAGAGIWFFLALSGSGGGILGEWLYTVITCTAGKAGAWVIAGALVWLGGYLIYLRVYDRPFVWGRPAWGTLLLLLTFQVAVQLAAYPDHPLGGDVENAFRGFGGGLVGYGLATLLTRAFGMAGRYVVLVTAALVAVVLNTGISLGQAIRWSRQRLGAAVSGVRGAAADLKGLLTASEEEAKAPSESGRKSGRAAAATEEMNTLERHDPEPATSEPTIRIGGTVEAPQPQPHSDPVVHLPQPVRREEAASQTATPARLVTDAKGQLALDPETLGDAYQLPPISMLPKPVHSGGPSIQDYKERADLLVRTLRSFGVEARVVEISPGPVVTRYELQPGEGVRVHKFTQLADDLALALAAEDIRIEAPIPGKAAVGIEVPNKVRRSVPLREVMETPAFLNSPSKLTVAFGQDNAGNPVVWDLAKMPHLLIAGSTGSGKSVCMNTIICSLLFKARPDEVKMLMIDPKMVELSTYNGIPHLMAPVITDPKKAAGYLKGAVKEMERRYELFAQVGARNIQQYNQICRNDPGPDPEHPRKPLPYVVIFIDELADLMMVAPVDVEDSICRLAQMARACGMHLVIATQSPRVDVITGLIKANIPSRIAFAVSSQVDSRVILDYAGAERLLGRGDMLFHPSGLSRAIRAQGAYIGEREVEALVKFVKAQAKPVYTAEEVAVEVNTPRRGAGHGEGGEPTSAVEAVFPQAVRIVIEHGQASVSILQRRLRCNYNKAARLIDMMEERGFIGPHQGSKPREVLITMAQWQELFGETESRGAGKSGSGSA
ncbi:MAG TPA: DNA translocase FtsK [Symbiobacteriaceae bacterium]